MKFHIVVFALVFATVWAKDLHSRSIEIPVLESEGRIANGKTATTGQFPYMVGINNNKSDYFYWCSGSFIAKDFILTAAHCIENTSRARVYMGATERLVAEEFYTVLRSNMTQHPDWNPRSYANNIGLIRIPITSLSGTIGFARIPKDDYNKYVDRSAIVAGWGQTSDETKSLSNDLKYLTLKVSPGSVCSEYFPHFFYINIHMCVSTPKSMSPCNGDEGSPLVLKEEIGNLQIGLFSFGYPNCETGTPVIFERIGVYVKWIRSHID